MGGFVIDIFADGDYILSQLLLLQCKKCHNKGRRVFGAFPNRNMLLYWGDGSAYQSSVELFKT